MKHLLVNLTGKPKKGKTVSAGTFPKKMLFIDFDRGFSSIQNTKGKDGKLVVPDWEQIQVLELYKKAITPMVCNTYQLVKGGATGPAPEYAKEGPDILKRINEIFNEIYAGKYGELQTLVIDNLTAMFRIWRDAVLYTNKIPELRKGDYLTLEGMLVSQFIPSLKSLNDKVPYIVCISHEDNDKNTEGQIIAEYPVGPTKSLGKTISEHFDELWRMESNAQGYFWRTRAHGLFGDGAGSRLDLPDSIPATFKSLEQYLK